MFTFQDHVGNVHSVSFKHHRKEKGGHRIPKATTCIIVDGKGGVTTSRVAPIGETIVVVPTLEEAYARFGRRVKRTKKTENGSYVITLRGDSFSYAKGREEALTKALLKGNYEKKDRARCWKAYNIEETM